MSDPNSRLKTRQMLIVGCALVGILVLVGAGMFMFDSGPTTTKKKPTSVTITAPGSVEDKERWEAKTAAESKATINLLNDVKSELKAQRDQSERLSKEVEELRNAKRTGANAGSASGGNYGAESSVLDKPLPVTSSGTGQRVLQSPNASQGLQVAGLNLPLTEVKEPLKRELEMIQFSSGTKTTTGVIPGDQGGNVEVLGFPTDEKAKRYAVTKGTSDQQPAIEFIPAGSFVRVTMLNGVNAPTGGQAQTDPLPVAFHVLDVANLANKHRLNIKDCRFVAAAYGDLSSERMIGRTETLSCIINGESVEMKVSGHVVGEDGKVGVKGRLVTKKGQLLANALFSGALSNVGRVLQQTATSVTSTGGGVISTIDSDKLPEAAIGGGLAGSANALAQYYLKAADKLFPVIETDGGRVVEILVTKGAVYTGKALRKDEYRGLMKRTGMNSRSYEDD